MIYLATPFTHDDPEVVRFRIDATKRLFYQLLTAGRGSVFSPILQTYETACAYELPTDARFWQDYNTGFIRRSDSMIVGMLPGWDQSKGVTQEISLAEQLNLTVEYISFT